MLDEITLGATSPILVNLGQTNFSGELTSPFVPAGTLPVGTLVPDPQNPAGAVCELGQSTLAPMCGDLGSTLDYDALLPIVNQGTLAAAFGTTLTIKNAVLDNRGGTLNGFDGNLVTADTMLANQGGTIIGGDEFSPWVLHSSAIVGGIVMGDLSIVDDFEGDDEGLEAAVVFDGVTFQGEVAMDVEGTVLFVGGSQATGNMEINLGSVSGDVGQMLIGGSATSVTATVSTLSPGSSIRIDGGTLTSSLNGIGAAAIEFTSSGGVLNVADDGSDFLVLDPDGQFGDKLTLKSGETIRFLDPLFSTVDLFDASAELTIDGGTLAVGDVMVDPTANFQFLSGTLNLTNSGLSIGVDPFIDILGSSVQITTGKNFILRFATEVGATGTLNIDGGSLTTSEIIVDPSGSFAFTSGNLALTSANLNIDSSGVLGPNLQLDADRQLSVAQTLVVSAAGNVAINGGAHSFGSVDNTSGGVFAFNTGQLEISGAAGLTIGPGALLGSNVLLNESRQLVVTNALTVDTTAQLDVQGRSLEAGSLVTNGIVTGDGRIDAQLMNNATGHIQVAAGDRLTFTGAGNDNQGTITINGGAVVFQQDLVNNSTINIDAGTLIADGSWTNNSDIITQGAANLGGNLQNAAGGLVDVVTGTATFFDDVVNEGEIRTQAGAFSVFLGSVTGSGSFTQGGLAVFEGYVEPGSSPGTMSMAGDVGLGADATLAIELAGRQPGLEHDQLLIAGDLVLDGSLEVRLLDEFQPNLPGCVYHHRSWRNALRRVRRTERGCHRNRGRRPSLPDHIRWRRRQRCSANGGSRTHEPGFAALHRILAGRLAWRWATRAALEKLNALYCRQPVQSSLVPGYSNSLLCVLVATVARRWIQLPSFHALASVATCTHFSKIALVLAHHQAGGFAGRVS